MRGRPLAAPRRGPGIWIAAAALVALAGAALYFFVLAGGVSAEEFRAEVNALCEGAREDTAELLQKLPPGANPQRSAGVLTEISERLEEFNTDLRAVEVPDEHEAKFEEFIAALEESNATGEEASAALQEGDQQKALEIIESGREGQADTDALAGDLGLTECRAAAQ